MPNSNSSPTTESSTRSTSRNLVDADGGGASNAPARPRSGFIRTGQKRSWSYSWKLARLDAQAGITVAAISLPQSMAYALIAGVDPRFGLYTAMIFTALGSIFGSSSHLINGPTGAVSLVVFSALSAFDPEAKPDMYEGMFLLGVMIGAIQILIAVFKLGDLTRYISESIITGFMAGAASLTIVGQVGNAHFLRDAQKQGFTVFLAGIRPDLRRGMERLGFTEFFPADRWFVEQDKERDSATLKAVRHAYQLLGIRRPTDTVAYYLV